MPIFAVIREVPEWLKGPAWKAGIGASLSRVRIPSSLQSKISRVCERSAFFMLGNGVHSAEGGLYNTTFRLVIDLHLAGNPRCQNHEKFQCSLS